MTNASSCEVVGRIFKEEGVNPLDVTIGKVTLSVCPNKQIFQGLKRKLFDHGYSLIEDNSEKISSRIKTALFELLSAQELTLKTNLSVYLSGKIHYEYHYLSTVFSDYEKISIEKYFIKLKIEKAKELIEKENLTLSEIAYQLGYSSPAHFTNQFKQTLGILPSDFKSSIK